MTPYELQIGKIIARKKFYSIPSVWKRLLGNLHNPQLYLSLNYGQMKQAKVEAKRIAKLKSKLFDNNHE